MTARATAATLAGAAALRVSITAAGDRSAEDPEVSFRFSWPENLPKR
jgi:protein NrfD